MNVTRLFMAVLAAGILGAGVTLVVGQGVPGGAPATSGQPSTNRPAPPVRDPRTPGYVTATNATELADGTVPPVTATGNFILGPTHPPAAEMTVQPGVPQGAVHDFTMNSADSKIYAGIARAEGTSPDGRSEGSRQAHRETAVLRRTRDASPSMSRSNTCPAPLRRSSSAPTDLIRCCSRPRQSDCAEARAVMIAISIGNGSGDAQGSQRGLEYDTMSGLYAEFVETEVLPLVEKQYNVRLTKDPDARATMGCSSGGSAALAMAWYRTDLYHRVLTYSGTYVNQQWPYNPETPGGAWEFHRTLIPNSPAKPLRIWIHVSDRDNFKPERRHARLGAGESAHGEDAGRQGLQVPVRLRPECRALRSHREGQTLAQALEWVWKD